MLPQPTGTITFLFSDIEGSTALWQRRPEQMRANLAIHDALLRNAIEHNQGRVFKTVGDAFCAAFQLASQGLQAAIEAQQALHSQDWGETIIRVRMGLHTGEADERDNDYFGNTLNRTARLMSAGHGGQVLLSMATQELVRDHLPARIAIEDLGQHRLKDLIRPEHLFQLVLPNLPHEFPPLKTLDYHPNNLPAQATPFVGREAELAALKKLLCDPSIRLLTLSGPGGTGKTRLALQAAAELLDDYADGVFFVPLAAATQPELIPLAIAQALDLHDTQGLPHLESIKTALREKAVLLVLDNLEQVVQAAPLLSELLSTLPRVKFLTTSRILLHVYGEHEFPVSPFNLPDIKNLPSLEQLTQYEAVHFFIQQAQLVRPGFQVNNENAPAVAEICHRLDGLPLALELAAARLRLMTPEKLLSQLSQRLSALSRGARDLPARQQTLRGAMDWSYNLLSAAEQVLFQQLAVFPGSFAVEAAEGICAVPENEEVLELLEQLIEKSLLKVVDQGSELRFVMLETLRDYAREKLQENLGDQAASQRHLQYFLTWAEAIAPRLYQRQMPACLDQLELDYANIQAALAWALEHDAQAGLRLCNAMHKFWRERGEYRQEGTAWFEKFLAANPAQRSASRSWALLHLVILIRRAGPEHPDLDSWLDESLDLSREIGDHSCTAMALAERGHILILKNDYDAPHQFLEQGLAEAQLAQDDLARGLIQHHLGVLAFYHGEMETAQQYLEASLSISKQHGDFNIWLHSTYMLGIINAALGKWEAAIRCHQEGLALAQEIRDRRNISMFLGELGNLTMGLGELEQARTHFHQARKMMEGTPDAHFLSTIFASLGELARLQGDFEQAAAYLMDLQTDGHKRLTDPGSRVFALCGLADAERQQNHLEAARKYLLAAIADCQQTKRFWIFSTFLIPFIAFFAHGQRKYADSAVLLAWAEKTNTDNRFPVHQQEIEGYCASAQAQLDETDFNTAWQIGQALTTEQVLVYAQKVLQPE